jgi:hypothetical protein
LVDYALRFLEKNCRDGKNEDDESGQEDETKNDN